ncbi:MAG TPA: Chromate resistance protein ChrB [Trueperaceae bacterium]
MLAWRRLRAAGAVNLQHGVWILPQHPEQEGFLRDLIEELKPQGGSGWAFVASAPIAEVDEDIIERFRRDRDEDYTEFCERCDDFLIEIEKETQEQKFTFAELEENEVDLEKLEGWLAKIQARDFFGGHREKDAVASLARCRDVLDDFAQTIYQREGLEASDPEPAACEILAAKDLTGGER